MPSRRSRFSTGPPSDFRHPRRFHPGIHFVTESIT
ncbi:Uncharacterised protein [Mycobacterium tuberculosis]|nr:Uncharacterised protein [Mycobacterium tuberculosis]